MPNYMYDDEEDLTPETVDALTGASAQTFDQPYEPFAPQQQQPPLQVNNVAVDNNQNYTAANAPQAQPAQQYRQVDPNRAMWAATLQNIGSLLSGQQAQVNPAAIMMQAQAHNEAMRKSQMGKQTTYKDLPSDVRSFKYAQTEAGGSYKGTFENFKEIGVKRTPSDLVLANAFNDPNVPDQVKQYLSAKYKQVTDVGGVPTVVSKLDQSASPITQTPQMIEEQNRIAQQEAGQQAEAARTKKMAVDAASMANENFKLIPKIQDSISTFKSAINTLDKGAFTGWVAKNLPSIRDASVELDNLRTASGLNVIGQTTFGALSKGELDLALSKDIPAGLSGDALRKYLHRKIEKQELLSKELLRAGVYLSQPGNTVASWYEQNTQPGATDQPGGVKQATSLDDFIIRGGK